jgi:putative tricarboxylic transport membrane protein
MRTTNHEGERQMNRREFLGAATVMAWASRPWGAAQAQGRSSGLQWMFETLNMFVPAAAGGGWDSTAHAIGRSAQAAQLIGTMRYENVEGDGGMVGLPRYVKQYQGRGDSLMVTGSVMVGAAIMSKSAVTLRNATPIARLTEEASVIAVPAGSEIQTWRDLENAFKNGPQDVPIAGGSLGGTDQILLALILKALGHSPREANYRAYSGGGQALDALLSGRVMAGISGYSEFAEGLDDGRLIPLAVSGETSIPGVGVPTLYELGMPVKAANRRALFAPPGISVAERDTLVRFITRLHESDAWQRELDRNHWQDVFQPAPEYDRVLETELRLMETVMKELGLV